MDKKYVVRQVGAFGEPTSTEFPFETGAFQEARSEAWKLYATLQLDPRVRRVELVIVKEVLLDFDEKAPEESA